MRETCRILLYFLFCYIFNIGLFLCARACVCMCAYVGGMHECVDVRGQRVGVSSPYHTVQGCVHIIRLYPQSHQHLLVFLRHSLTLQLTLSSNISYASQVGFSFPNARIPSMSHHTRLYMFSKLLVIFYLQALCHIRINLVNFTVLL